MTLSDCLQTLLSGVFLPAIQNVRPPPTDGLNFTSRQSLKATRSNNAMFDAWITSRAIPSRAGEFLAPGAHRSLTKSNARLAYNIVKVCAADLFWLLWTLHPWRTLLMVSLEFIRGIFPAFRGYSQALLVNELQILISSGSFTWPRLAKLIATEIARVGLESLIDSIASSNENIVHSSARFLVEYKQMEQRVRLDIPTLADPTIRDLLHESDLFVRSFNGMSSFGLFSTFDFMRIFTLLSELISHILVLSSLTFDRPHVSALLFSILSCGLPLLLRLRDSRPYPEQFNNPAEARLSAKQEKMRSLAHSDSHRQEIALFGLSPWILHSWARARTAMLGLEYQHSAAEGDVLSRMMSYFNISGLILIIQNVPLVLLLQSPSASLGSFTLYRSSVQSLFFTVGNLFHSISMAFQGIFLMAAFFAAMAVEPRLQPKNNNVAKYQSAPQGMRVVARNLSYAYPGCEDAAVKNVNLTIEAGETLAIVGFNGSGKSTLAKILLRVLDFDNGELLINDVDIRKYRLEEYHPHVTAVFQDFSKFNASVQENIGVGYIHELRNSATIASAMRLADATDIVRSLPQGLKTKLDVAGHSTGIAAVKETYSSNSRGYSHHGLSGGEWQRLALSRAFMRAYRPEVDLILFDEPTSSLDAHAQKHIFENIENISRSPTGGRRKTVIFITHRLATARRADKIAMMENGTISEFGTHDELLSRNGQYAALYRASI